MTRGDQRLVAEFEAARILAVPVFGAQHPVTTDKFISIADRGAPVNVNFHGSGKKIEWTNFTSIQDSFIDRDNGSKANPGTLDSVPQQTVSKHAQSVQREKADQGCAD